jgi:energy-coupling factor transporter ATP-binding protein EcfA2
LVTNKHIDTFFCMTKLSIRKFDPSTIALNSVILMIGRRGSGKSTLIKDIMFHLRNKLDFGVAMSPTEESNEAFSSYVPRSCIYADYSPSAIDTLIKQQRQQVKRGRFRHVYLLMDDCAFDKKTLTSTNMRQLMYNGRHSKITFCYSVQYLVDFPASFRSQVDYVFCLKDNVLSSKEKLHKFFFVTSTRRLTRAPMGTTALCWTTM